MSGFTKNNNRLKKIKIKFNTKNEPIEHEFYFIINKYNTKCYYWHFEGFW